MESILVVVVSGLADGVIRRALEGAGGKVIGEILPWPEAGGRAAETPGVAPGSSGQAGQEARVEGG